MLHSKTIMEKRMLEDQIVFSFPFLNKEKGNVVTTVKDKIYIDGYEYIDGEWKRTFKAFWNRWF